MVLPVASSLLPRVVAASAFGGSTIISSASGLIIGPGAAAN
jgi:hypothetical protein